MPVLLLYIVLLALDVLVSDTILFQNLQLANCWIFAFLIASFIDFFFLFSFFFFFVGCFIVIDSMLERMKHEKSIDIYGHVTCLRAQRNYMVQTEDQYIFIHDALLEAVICGLTEIPARNLHAHIQKLMQPEIGENVTGMELEFKKLSNIKTDSSRFVTANLPCNKHKNRLVHILPFESTRVCLQPIRNVDGSDYINASFIDGYRYRKAYIATQGPLVDTTDDLWRMLWEHNSTIIVMLTKLKEMGRVSFGSLINCDSLILLTRLVTNQLSFDLFSFLGKVSSILAER